MGKINHLLNIIALFSNFNYSSYGTSESHFEATSKMLESMNNKLLYPNSPLKFETALFLSPNQAEALNHFNFIVTGFYGAGKTTALECAIDKIIEKPTEFPNPKMILCTWDESQELQRKFKEKMEKIKSQTYPHLNEDSLQVVSLKDVCDQYQVKPMQSWQWSWLRSWFWLDRSKVDILNDLCRKIKGKCVTFFNFKL